MSVSGLCEQSERESVWQKERESERERESKREIQRYRKT